MSAEGFVWLLGLIVNLLLRGDPRPATGQDTPKPRPHSMKVSWGSEEMAVERRGGLY